MSRASEAELHVVGAMAPEAPIDAQAREVEAQMAERSFAWLASVCRLTRDHECLPQTVAELTFLAFTCLMLQQLIHLPFSS